MPIAKNTEGSLWIAPRKNQRTVSTTDPDSGMFVKGEHERQIAYVANTACDRNSFMLAFHLGAGNIHDSQMFHEMYRNMNSFLPKIECVAVNAGYKTPGIMREIAMSGAVPVVPYKCPMTKKGFFRKHEYAYDEYYDCYICPANKILAIPQRAGTATGKYKSNPNDCRSCPYLQNARQATMQQGS